MRFYFGGCGSVHCLSVSGNGIGGSPNVARKAFCNPSSVAKASGEIVFTAPDARPACTLLAGVVVGTVAVAVGDGAGVEVAG